MVDISSKVWNPILALHSEFSTEFDPDTNAGNVEAKYFAINTKQY